MIERREPYEPRDCEEQAKHDRWFITLLNADIEYADAQNIIAGLQAPDDEAVAA